MADSIWPKRENEQFFRFFNKDYQLIVGAAKILSVLGERKDASLHNFQHGPVALPCCNENGRFNMADTAAASMFGSL